MDFLKSMSDAQLEHEHERREADAYALERQAEADRLKDFEERLAAAPSRQVRRRMTQKERVRFWAGVNAGR